MQGRTVLQGKGILCPREQQTTNQAFEIDKKHKPEKIEEEKTERKEKTRQKGF